MRATDRFAGDVVGLAITEEVAGSVVASQNQPVALVVVAAGSLAVAAGVHLAAFPAHRSEGPAVAGFFIATAVLQLAAAIIVGRSTGLVRAAIVVGNLALLSLWLVSRTSGLPVGGHAGAAETFGPLDLTAASAQGCAVAIVLMLPRTPRRHALAAPAVTLLILAIVVAVVGVRLVPSSHGDHDRASDPTQPRQTASTGEQPGADDHGALPAEAPRLGAAGEGDTSHHDDPFHAHEEPHAHP